MPNINKLLSGNRVGEIARVLNKAINTSAGSGGDFLPTPLASEFINFVRDKNFLRQMFRNVPMMSKTRDIPKILSGLTVYFENTETTDAVSTDLGSGTVRLTAKKFLAYARIASEAFEDSAFDMDMIIRDSFAQAAASGEENAMIQGDTTHTANASTPSAATSSNWYSKDQRLIYDGLLKKAKDISDAAPPVDCSGQDMSTTLARQAMHNLGKYGRVMSDLVLILNPWSVNQLLDDSKLVTLEKYGVNATIFTGEIGKLYGKITVINSAFMEDGYGVMTHIGNPVIGDRRQIKIEQEREAKKDATDYVFSERHDFTIEYGDAVCYLHTLDTQSELS
ncbi:MAG: phage major capsid protein [Candidatus Lokiarchaeota archaeon]|nr:phage major capsid protein [Candidatus Lokiarchaeota archaeon]